MSGIDISDFAGIVELSQGLTLSFSFISKTASETPASAADLAVILDAERIANNLPCIPRPVTLNPIISIKTTISTTKGSTPPLLAYLLNLLLVIRTFLYL
jgi:hypothetical protein